VFVHGQVKRKLTLTRLLQLEQGYYGPVSLAMSLRVLADIMTGSPIWSVNATDTQDKDYSLLVYTHHYSWWSPSSSQWGVMVAKSLLFIVQIVVWYSCEWHSQGASFLSSPSVTVDFSLQCHRYDTYVFVWKITHHEGTEIESLKHAQSTEALNVWHALTISWCKESNTGSAQAETVNWRRIRTET
jgi:hypothetical protein